MSLPQKEEPGLLALTGISQQPLAGVAVAVGVGVARGFVRTDGMRVGVGVGLRSTVGVGEMHPPGAT